MICFRTSAENFAISSAFFVAISFISLGCQKKEYSDSVFGSGDVDDVVTFEGEASSFMSSTSGFQKKERSETDFVHGDTGDEMSFAGGIGILTSVTLYGLWAFRETTFCTGGEAIVVLMIGNDG